MNKIRSIYWKLADIMLFPLALIAALGALENSYAYGYIGALLSGVSINDFAACEVE